MSTIYKIPVSFPPDTGSTLVAGQDRPSPQVGSQSTPPLVACSNYLEDPLYPNLFIQESVYGGSDLWLGNDSRG